MVDHNVNAVGIHGALALCHEAGAVTLCCIVLRIEVLDHTAIYNDLSSAVVVVGIDAVERVDVSVLVVNSLEVSAVDGQDTLGYRRNRGNTYVVTVLNGQVTGGGAIGCTQYEDVIGCDDLTVLHGCIGVVLYADDGIYITGQLATIQINGHILADHNGLLNLMITDDLDGVACLCGLHCISKAVVVVVTVLGNQAGGGGCIQIGIVDLNTDVCICTVDQRQPLTLSCGEVVGAVDDQGVCLCRIQLQDHGVGSRNGAILDGRSF